LSRKLAMPKEIPIYKYELINTDIMQRWKYWIYISLLALW
jgi:hypothetical protein